MRVIFRVLTHEMESVGMNAIVCVDFYGRLMICGEEKWIIITNFGTLIRKRPKGEKNDLLNNQNL